MGILVALDDGHGMETPGKRSPHIPELKRSIGENAFNSKVVFYLAEDLKRSGIDVLLVSPASKDTPLSERTNLANNEGVDAYISIHYNAFDGTFKGENPSGISLHVYPGHREKEAGELAENIANYLKLGTSQFFRGIKESDFHVLRETNMPAVLTENGFMDHPVESRLMLSDSFQKEVAKEHAMGICDFFGVEYIYDGGSKQNMEKIEELEKEIHQLKYVPDWMYDAIVDQFSGLEPYLEKPSEWKKRLANHEVTTSELTGLFAIAFLNKEHSE